MSDLSRSQVEAALAAYTDPYLNTDLVSAGCVRDIRITGAQVAVDIHLDYPSEFLKGGVAQLLQTALENLDGCQRRRPLTSAGRCSPISARTAWKPLPM